MTPIYGKDFAFIYNRKWAFFGEKMWPFIRQHVMIHNPDATSWLDLCCGTGSLLKYVCQNGYQAIGVDSSLHQLKYARKNAPRARFLRKDIRELSLSQRFDVVTCLYDSLNYLTSKKDLQTVFRKTRHHLNPEGVFIFDMNTYEGLKDGWNKISTLRETYATVIIETSFDERKKLGRCLITGFIKEGGHHRKFEEEHVERGYTALEIETLLDRTGFFYNKFDGDRLAQPRLRSARLLYVCRKEE